MARASIRGPLRAVPALLVLCLAAEARAADFTRQWTALPAAVGPGGVALVDLPPGTFGNPALLAAAARHEARGDLALDAEGSAWQHVGLTWVSAADGTFALSFAHLEPSSDGARSQEFRVAYGRGIHGSVRLGATLDLGHEPGAGSERQSFGVALGISGRLAGLDWGAVVRHAVQPSTAGGADPRGLEIGMARNWLQAGNWRGAATFGWEGTDGATSRGWLGARFVWRERFEVMGSGTDHAARFGMALHRGRAALEYAVDASGEVRHALGVRVAIGPSVQERRLAAARRADSLVAARVASEIVSRQAREVSARLASAEQTMADGAFDRAADLYREVLLWSPENTVASAGLRRAQLGAMLAQADSAIARLDWWRAASQLEHAQQLFPADSLVVAKLESVRAAQRRVDRTRTEAAEEVRLGLDAYATQHYAVAARRFEAALRLDPANQTAGELLQLSRAAHEAQVRTALDQARARLQRRDPEGARAALEPAFAAAPDRPEVAQLAAQIDRERDRQEREIRVAEVRRREAASREDRAPAPVSQPELTATYERGMQMYRTGDLASAMVAWEEIARVSPHFEEVDRYLLRVYRVVGLENYTEGRLQEAIEVWSKALRLEPENLQVRRYLEQANAKLQRAQDFGGER